VAKKARRKDEEDATPSFEFPEFDEQAFLAHEFEQFRATVLAFSLGVALGIAAFLIGDLGFSPYLPLIVGFVGTAALALVIRQLRPASSEYTKGDWASLIVLIFFGFLGVWFLAANLACGAGLSGLCRPA
jgi:hypothetical protein